MVIYLNYVIKKPEISWVHLRQVLVPGNTVFSGLSEHFPSFKSFYLQFAHSFVVVSGVPVVVGRHRVNTVDVETIPGYEYLLTVVRCVITCKGREGTNAPKQCYESSGVGVGARRPSYFVTRSMRHVQRAENVHVYINDILKICIYLEYASPLIAAAGPFRYGF